MLDAGLSKPWCEGKHMFTFLIIPIKTFTFKCTPTLVHSQNVHVFLAAFAALCVRRSCTAFASTPVRSVSSFFNAAQQDIFKAFARGDKALSFLPRYPSVWNAEDLHNAERGGGLASLALHASCCAQPPGKR